MKNYPPGSKCEALRLGVHLILLYFIRISLLYPKIFVLFGRWVVGGVPLFWFFKSPDNNIVYSLSIHVFVYKRDRCTAKVLRVLKFGEVGDRTNENQNPIMYDAYWFFMQNFFFCGAECYILYLVSNFLNYKGKIYIKR